MLLTWRVMFAWPYPRGVAAFQVHERRGGFLPHVQPSAGVAGRGFPSFTFQINFSRF